MVEGAMSWCNDVMDRTGCQRQGGDIRRTLSTQRLPFGLVPLLASLYNENESRPRHLDAGTRQICRAAATPPPRLIQPRKGEILKRMFMLTAAVSVDDYSSRPHLFGTFTSFSLWTRGLADQQLRLTQRSLTQRTGGSRSATVDVQSTALMAL